MAPADAIAILDRSLSALRELWVVARERGPREDLFGRINALLDQRLVLMRLRDSGQPVLCIVLTPIPA